MLLHQTPFARRVGFHLCISVLTLSVDILGQIVKPSDEKLKTSLYAIEKIATAYGLDMQTVKVGVDALEFIEGPFIANQTHTQVQNSSDFTANPYLTSRAIYGVFQDRLTLIGRRDPEAWKDLYSVLFRHSRAGPE